jgi:hypothetical protein
MKNLIDYIEECGEGCTTPGNTMGMGNPMPPMGDQPGTEPIKTIAGPKQEKKETSKRKKKKVNEGILDIDKNKGDLDKNIILAWLKKVAGDDQVEKNISLNDDEFYFLIGQTIKYLFSQSEAQKIQYNKYFDCIDKKDSKQIKEQLNLLFKKYAHKISTKNFKFNNVYSFILSYEPQNKKVDLDMLLLGFMYNENIYFIKSEKEEESTDNVD